MKNFAMVILFLALTSAAQAYQEKLERIGNTLRGSWVSQESARVPIAGNFYAFNFTYVSKDLSCDDFAAKVHSMISDWNKYPNLNLYALTWCTVPADAKSSTEFIYAFDTWVPEAVPQVVPFLKDHQGVGFEGEPMNFSKVVGIDVNTVLSLDVLKGTALTLIHSAQSSKSYSGTDQWYPDNYARSKIIEQTQETVFLDFVARDFGGAEKTAFQQSLPSANFVGFSDFFTLHLEDSQIVDFWLGFGDTRSCKTQPCFSTR